MFKDICAAIAGVTLGFLAWNYIQPTVQSMDAIMAASVQIESYCSGTVIKDPDTSDGIQFTVITAKHCLSPGQGIGTVLTVNIPTEIANVFTTMTKIKTIVKDVDANADLILLQGLKQDEGLNIEAIDVYQGTVKFGDYAISVSYPYALSKFVTDGYLGYILELAPFSNVSKSTLYQTSTVHVAGGSSGSGLFKPSSWGYQLIGVLTGGVGHISAYTPLDEVRAFLNKQVKQNV